MRLWRESKERKPRSDSKLHRLAKEQRALVDKWLFDKGLTYQEVSDACREMFGLRVSKSSVGRYHEREARAKVRRKKGRQSLHPMAGTLEENYQECLKRMTAWALEELRWPVADEQDVRTVLRFMRILISSRRERNEEKITKLAREKFEMRVARECFNYMKKEEARERASRREESKWRVASGEERWPGRGEKDPMMVWDFPDGEIRRMPPMRQQAGPAPNFGNEENGRERTQSGGPKMRA
jgi:ribosome-binding protein aMBF1 (putative translation factor)